VKFEVLPIVDHPPTLAELKKMAAYRGDFRKLFNTSGLVYKEMGLSKKLDSMTESEALKLLASNGRLIKRPFVLGPDFGLQGFREQDWKTVLK
jgi:arsenate reductase